MIVAGLGCPWSVTRGSVPASMPKKRFRSLPWLPQDEPWWSPIENPRRDSGSNSAATSPIPERGAAGTSIQAVSVNASVPRTIPATSRRPPASTSHAPTSPATVGASVTGSRPPVVDELPGDDRAQRLDCHGVRRYPELRHVGGRTDAQGLVPALHRQPKQARRVRRHHPDGVPQRDARVPDGVRDA